MYNGSSIMGWSTNSSKYPWRGWKPHVCWDIYPRTVHWNCTSSRTDQPPHHRSPGGHRTHWHRRHGHWHGMAGMPLLGAWVRVEWGVADVLSCHENWRVYWAKMRQASLFLGTSTGNRCDYIALRWEHQGAKVGTPVLIGCDFHSDKHAIWCYGLWYGR